MDSSYNKHSPAASIGWGVFVSATWGRRPALAPGASAGEDGGGFRGRCGYGARELPLPYGWRRLIWTGCYWRGIWSWTGLRSAFRRSACCSTPRSSRVEPHVRALLDCNRAPNEFIPSPPAPRAVDRRPPAGSGCRAVDFHPAQPAGCLD